MSFMNIESDNPYKSPASSDASTSVGSGTRWILFRDFVFSTLVQWVLAVVLAPGDGGRWVRRAIPFLLVGNLLLGWLYFLLWGRAGENENGVPMWLLVLSGMLLFVSLVWFA